MALRHQEWDWSGYLISINKSINTSVRIDGKYYRYRGVDEVIVPSRVNLTSSDGQPYKYIGYYVGGTGNYNGFESKRLKQILTFYHAHT